MSEAPPTRRRWFQFGLRKMLVGVTVLAGLSWIAASFPWPIASGRVYGVNIGMTEAEVVGIMGQPHHQGSNCDGSHYWTWNREIFHVTVVVFSRDGSVRDRFDD